MKRCVLLSAILIILGSTAFAQAPKPFDLYLGGGMTFGSSPEAFKAAHKEGYHLAAGLGFNFAPMLQFVGKLEYHTFSKDFDQFLPSVTDLDGGTRRLVMVGVDARLRLSIPTAPIRPFALAGIGFGRMSESDYQTALAEALPDDEIALLDFENRTDFYFNIGGGMEFKAMQILNVFIQARYINLKQDDDNLVIIPVTVGLKF